MSQTKKTLRPAAFRRSSEVPPYHWDLSHYTPYNNGHPSYPDGSPLSVPLHPVLERILSSRLARAVEGACALDAAAVLAGWALSLPVEQLKEALALLTAVPFFLVGLASWGHLVEHNLLTFARAVEAWRLSSPPEPTPPASTVVIEPGPTQTEKEIEFIEWNGGKSKKTIPVDEVNVDTRDFAEFLWEAWTGEGGQGRGLKRDDWLGNGADILPFRFPTTGTEITRDYYDAIIHLLDKRLHLIKGRARGWSGELALPPDEILAKFQWIS